MKKKLYLTPTIEYIGVESETLMLTATVARTTTNQEAATGQQGGSQYHKMVMPKKAM